MIDRGRMMGLISWWEECFGNLVSEAPELGSGLNRRGRLTPNDRTCHSDHVFLLVHHFELHYSVQTT